MKLLYFSWVREKIGIDQEEIDIPKSVETIADVISWLKGRGAEFECAFQQSDVICAAIDQKHVAVDAPISGAREIAFFPPVTGG